MTSVFDRIAGNDGDDAESEEEQVIDPETDREEVAPNATPVEVKQVTQELLKQGFIEEKTKSVLFRQASIRRSEVLTALEPLDLSMKLDELRGVAFLIVDEGAYGNSEEESAWSHPLVRRQRLTLEQSLLIAILRQVFVLHEQECGVGQSDARVAVYDLLPQFLAYLEDSGSDQKNESRLLNLLDQLKGHGVVAEVDSRQEVIIRPMIAHLANPESLSALLKVFREKAAKSSPEDQS